MSHLSYLLTCMGIFAVLASASSDQQNTAARDLTARDGYWGVCDLIACPQLRTVPKHRDIKLVTKLPPGATTIPKQPSPSIATNTPPLGLKVSVLQQMPDKKTFKEVSQRTEFYTGDSFRLSIEVNQKGYLYVIHQGASGSWIPLYPKPEAAGTNNVEPWKQYVIPSGIRVWTFDNTPGLEKFFVLLTREPEKDLDQTIRKLQSQQQTVLVASNGISDQTINQLHDRFKSRDVFETDLEHPDSIATELQDNAIYFVNTAALIQNQHVIADVVLSHRSLQ